MDMSDVLSPCAQQYGWRWRDFQEKPKPSISRTKAMNRRFVYLTSNPTWKETNILLVVENVKVLCRHSTSMPLDFLDRLGVDMLAPTVKSPVQCKRESHLSVVMRLFHWYWSSFLLVTVTSNYPATESSIVIRYAGQKFTSTPKYLYNFGKRRHLPSTPLLQEVFLLAYVARVTFDKQTDKEG